MTYYDVLGLKRNATQKEIKESYKKLAKKYHPDIYKGDKTFAEKKMKEINLAYDVLSDPSSKAAYDEEIAPRPIYTYARPNYTTSNYYASSDYNNDYRYYTSTTSSTYAKIHEMHNKFSDDILKKVSELKRIQKILIVLIILVIYVFLLILSFDQYDKVNSDEYTSTLLGPVKKETVNDDDTSYKDSAYYNNRKDFSIEDYITDEELHNYYENSEYKHNYSFEEYKEIMENYLYQSWY